MSTRRAFLAGLLGAAGAQSAAPPVRWALSGYIWQDDIEQGIRDTARFGFHGIEPFRQNLMRYLDNPRALKEKFDAAGLAMATCSNGGPGMMTNFIDPAHTAQSIEDHFRFARDFLTVFGCRHFKINLGSRPPEGPTREHLKVLAGALNELGKRTADVGLRLAAHPHLWGVVEREEEVRRMMEWTDPRYVWLVPDTAHLRLGGSDPFEIIRDYYPRVAALHFKDTPARYRGHRGPSPTLEEHKKENLYKNLGTGGVDFPAIMKLLRERDYRGWITLDLDPPRPGEGTIEENVLANKRYLTEVLKVDL
jgi:inosose dehydratase